MARPAGLIREQLREMRRRGWAGGTWKDACRELGARRVINPAARAEVRLVRHSLNDMVRSGEVERGPLAVYMPGVRRPMTVYLPVQTPDQPGTTQDALLAAVIFAWR